MGFRRTAGGRIRSPEGGPQTTPFATAESPSGITPVARPPKAPRGVRLYLEEGIP